MSFREDFFDIYDLALELDRSMAALRKLSSDPRRSWSQIRMGFLKWIARYTADCKVERESQKHTGNWFQRTPFYKKIHHLSSGTDKETD